MCQQLQKNYTIATLMTSQCAKTEFVYKLLQYEDNYYIDSVIITSIDCVTVGNLNIQLIIRWFWILNVLLQFN